MTYNNNTKQSACYTQVTDGLTKRQNLQTVSDAVYRLINYRKFLASARTCNREENNSQLHRHLARRAFMAEADIRTVLKIGIDSMNIIRDFGELGKYIAHIRDNHSESMFSNKQIEAAFNEVGKSVGKMDSPIDTSFLSGICGEVLKLKEKHNFGFTKSEDNIQLQFKDEQAKGRTLLVKPGFVSWQTVTMTSAQFFMGSGSAITATLSPVLIKPDCHHEAQKIINAAVKTSFDVYGATLGQFAMARELIYNHARKIDELGIGYFNGNWELAVALIVTAIVIAVIAVAVYYSHGEANIICHTDQTGQTMCEDADSSSSSLSVSYASTLVGVAIGLSGITCAALSGNCTLQSCPLLPIQG